MSNILPDLSAQPLFPQQDWLYSTPQASSVFFDGPTVTNLINNDVITNESGDFINDVINARIDTASKYILSDFNFGSTDYSGGIKVGTITWNTTTGAVTGGDGIVISRAGILGAKSGVATFTITNAGDATFAGTLAAASGTLGSITIGTNAWHVDSSGNMWWGNFATYAAATYKIGADGTGNFSGLTVGTNVAVGSGSAYSGVINTAYVNALNITVLGTVTTGTLTGVNVNSSSGNNRISLTSGDTVDFYYTGDSVGQILSSSGGLEIGVDSYMYFKIAGVNHGQWIPAGDFCPYANNGSNLGRVDVEYTLNWANAWISTIYATTYYGGGNAGQTASDSFVTEVWQTKDGDGFVTNVQYKDRPLAVTGGIVTTWGNESALTDAG